MSWPIVPRMVLRSSSAMFTPLKATAWSSRLWASRMLPSAASAMRGQSGGHDGDAFLLGDLHEVVDDVLVEDLAELEMLAARDDGRGNLVELVVAKMKTVFGGGSSSVLSRALNPSLVI